MGNDLVGKVLADTTTFLGYAAHLVSGSAFAFGREFVVEADHDRLLAAPTPLVTACASSPSLRFARLHQCGPFVAALGNEHGTIRR
jgi:hypothetical protein